MSLQLGTAVAVIDMDISGLTSKAGQASATLNQLDSAGKGAFNSASAASQSFGQRILANKENLMALGAGMAVFGLATGKAFKTGLGAAADFQQGMKNIQAVTGATAPQLDMLRQRALQIGKDTKFSAGEAQSAIEELAKTGVGIDDIYNGAAAGVANLATATGSTLDTAVSVVSGTMTQFGFQGKDVTKIVDTLARGANAARTDVAGIGDALQYVGGYAHEAGFSLQDTVTAIVAMNNAGLDASQSGTGFREVLASMAKPTKEAQAALDAAGVSFYDLNGQMKPLPSIIEQVATATKGMTQQQRDNFLQTVFGVRGATAMNALLATQSDEAKKTGRSWQDYYKQVTSGSTAAEQAQTRMDSLSGSLENLRGSLETAAVVAFTSLLGPIKAVVDFVNQLVDAFLSLPHPIQTAVAAVLGLSAGLGLIGGAVLFLLPHIVSMINAWGVLRTILFGVSEAQVAAGLATETTTGLLSGTLGPILAVAAALGALYLAYKTNFLGFGDATRGFVEKVKDIGGAVKGVVGSFGDLYAGWRKQGYGPFSASLMAVGDGIRKAFGARTVLDSVTGLSKKVAGIFGGKGAAKGFGDILSASWKKAFGGKNADPAKSWADKLVGHFGKGQDASDDLRDSLLATSKTAVKLPFGQRAALAFADALTATAKVTNTLGKYFGETFRTGNTLNGLFDRLPAPLQRVGQSFAILFDTAHDLKAAFDQGGLLGVFRAIPDELKDVGQAVAEFGRGLNDLFTLAATSFPRFNTFFRDMGTIARDAFTTIGHGISVVGSLLMGDWSGALVQAKRAWDSFVATLGDIGQLATDIGSALGGLAVDLGNWVLNVGVPAAVNFLGSVAKWIEDAIPTVAATLKSWILSVGKAAVNFLVSVEHSVQDAIGTAAVTIKSWILSVGQAAVNFTVSVAQSIQNSFGAVIATLGSWILNVGQAAVNWTVSVATSLQNNWGAVVATLHSWILNVGEAAVNFTTSIQTAIENQMPTVTAKLNSWGLTLGTPSPITGLSLGDLKGAIQNYLNGLGTIAAELNEWQIILGQPQVKDQSGGSAAAGGKPSWWQTILADLQTAQANPFPITPAIKIVNWAFSDPGPAIENANNKVQALVKSIKKTYDGPAFAIHMPAASSISFMAGYDLGGDLVAKLGPPIAAGLGKIGDWVRGLTFSLDIPRPDFTWPNLDLVTEAIKHFAGGVNKVIHVPIKFVIDFINGTDESGAGAPGATGATGGSGGISPVGGGGKGLEVAQFASNLSGINTALGNVGTQATKAAANIRVFVGAANPSTIGAIVTGFGGLATSATTAAIGMARLAPTSATLQLLGQNMSRMAPAANSAATGLALVGASGAAMGQSVAASANLAATNLNAFVRRARYDVPGSAQIMAQAGTLMTNMLDSTEYAVTSFANAVPDLSSALTFMAVGATGALTDFYGQAQVAFVGIGAAATTGLAPVPAIIGAVAASALGVAVPAFLGILTSAQAGFTPIPAVAGASMGAMLTSVAGNTAAAATTAAANTASMAASVAGNAASMASRGISSASNMNSGMTAQFIGVAAAASARSATMAAMVAANGAAMAQSGISSAMSYAAGIGNGMSLAAAFAANGAAAVRGALAGMDLSGAGYATGASFGAGVVAGLYAMLGAVQAAAAAIVSAAAAAAAAKAMIHSPSRLFRDQIGVQLAAGMAEGIYRGVPLVERAAGSLVGVPGTTPMPAGARGGNVYNSSHTFHITQREGESAEQLAQRIWAEGARAQASMRG